MALTKHKTELKSIVQEHSKILNDHKRLIEQHQHSIAGLLDEALEAAIPDPDMRAQAVEDADGDAHEVLLDAISAISKQRDELFEDHQQISAAFKALFPTDAEQDAAKKHAADVDGNDDSELGALLAWCKWAKAELALRA